MIGYILLYGMPALLAQGLLFVGFIYCLAYFMRFIEWLCKKKRKTIETPMRPKEIVSKRQNTTTKKYVAPKKYKFIIKILSDVAQIDDDSQYILFDIKSVSIGDKQLIVNEEDKPLSTINTFYNVQKCIETFWRIEINEIDFDQSEFKLICLFKDTIHNGFSIYSGSQIIYRNLRFSMHRIEDTRLITGCQSAYAFDNWVVSSGLNDRPPIYKTANKRIL